MKESMLITVCKDVNAGKLCTWINSFKKLQATAVENNRLEISYDTTQIAAKMVLKIVGMFNKSRTGRKTKVLSISSSQPHK